MSNQVSINVNLTDILDDIINKIDTDEQLRKKLIVLMSKLNLNEKSVDANKSNEEKPVKSDIPKFVDPRKCIFDKYGNKRYYSRFNEETKQHEEGDLYNSYEYTDESGIKVNLPAIEYADGTKEWLLNGALHRTDGPANEGANGSKFWFIRGKRHRMDGPAIEGMCKHREWFINGKDYSESAYYDELKKFVDPRECVVDTDGDKRYYSRFNEETKQHETGGDLKNSYEYTNEFGVKVNLPSIDCANGDKWWHINDKLHRIDGPAIDCVDGHKEWYFNDKNHRIDGPAVEHKNGDKFWCFDGEFHRIDGPAIVHTNGYKEWCFNGKRHRIDGPAAEYADGTKKWYINDKEYSQSEYNSKIEKLNSIKMMKEIITKLQSDLTKLEE